MIARTYRPFHVRSGLGNLGSLGLVSCPEGAVRDSTGNACVCRTGRVWTSDRSKCVSPQGLALMAGTGLDVQYQQSIQQGVPYNQVNLTDSARRYIESQGHTITCKLQSNWDASPAGGNPTRVCSIDGGPFEHGAYAINANPGIALTSAKRTSIGQNVALETGLPAGSGAAGALTQQQLIRWEAEQRGSPSSSIQGDEMMDLFTDEIAIGGMSIPTWMLIAGGLAAFWMMNK